MKLLLLAALLISTISVHSQTTKEPTDAEIDKFALEEFSEGILKEAKWVEVAKSVSREIFSVDTESLRREKNRIEFYAKIDKRGNLKYLKFEANCLTDSFRVDVFGFVQEVGEPLRVIRGGVSVDSTFGGAREGTTMEAMIEFACTEGAKKK
jgi:hypothetical protein